MARRLLPAGGAGTAGVTATGTVTVTYGSSFAVSGAGGDIVAGGAHGLFVHDTRLVSELVVAVDGEVPEPLESVHEDPFAATFVARCRPREGQDATLLVERQRFVGTGMRERIVIRNLSPEATYCRLELRVAADFATAADVRSATMRPAPAVQVHAEGAAVRFATGKGPRRGVVVVARPDDQAATVTATDDGVLACELIVPASGRWATWFDLVPVFDGEELEPGHSGGRADSASPAQRLDRWRRGLPTIDTDHDDLELILARSMEDLGTLRLYDPDYPERVVTAAGAPWSMDLHGRDAVFTSWMALVIDPELAIGVVETLARFQGEEEDVRTEEEPGRILQHIRLGPTAGGSWHGAAYGAVDTTPLFVMLLGELRRWGLATEVVDRLLPHADRALAWVDEHGDRDGDGFIEYQRPTDKGMAHQGWRDSAGTIRHRDGRLATTPIALAEVQAYLYAAYRARYHFAVETDDVAGAGRWRVRAEHLRRKFNDEFWNEETGTVAMALDHDKRQVDGVCSSMGHCLWTGILDPDKAAVVAARLMEPDLYTGWGIRTLSSATVGYSPVSYQSGSVWPHDNAIAASGLMRYGFVDEAVRLIESMLDAAVAFGGRLPELFAGFDRSDLAFPVRHPGSCSPQAWSAAAPLSFLRTLLRLEPWVPSGQLRIAPVLPEHWGVLRIDGVPLLGGRVSIEAQGTTAKVEGLAGRVEVLDEPRPAHGS